MMISSTTCRFTGLALACAMLTAQTSAQNSEFTYQGELRQNGTLAHGQFNMTFSLWNAVVGGTQIDSDNVLNGVSVADGKFTVDLDFGAASFDNSNRWLEIEVNGSTLVPRNQITRSPYSVQTRGIYVDPEERVGIGTTNPQVQLDLESSTESALRLTTTDNNPNNLSKLQLKTVDAPGAFNPLGRIEFIDQTDNLKSFIQGTKGPGGSALLDLSVTPGQIPQISIDSLSVDVNSNLNVADNLGIGTIAPEGPLHVQEGSAGSVTAQSSSSAIFERSGQNFVSILSPDASERGILFGDPMSNVNGGIIYNNTATQDGFQFRTGVNQNRMVIASNGNVGIGTTNPGGKLDVVGDSTFRNRLGIGNPSSFFGQLTINDSGDGSIFGLDVSSDNDNFPTIFATNSGSGGVLWTDGNSDVEPEGGGVIVVGNQAATNMGIDNNEIMARFNGQPSTLFLNADGGNIKMGPQQAHPAFAYARLRGIPGLVGISSGTSNVLGINRLSDGVYSVEVEGGVLSTDVVIISSNQENRVGKAGIEFLGGGTIEAFICRTYEVGSGDPRNSDFSLLIFRP